MGHTTDWGIVGREVVGYALYGHRCGVVRAHVRFIVNCTPFVSHGSPPPLMKKKTRPRCILTGTSRPAMFLVESYRHGGYLYWPPVGFAILVLLLLSLAVDGLDLASFVAASCKSLPMSIKFCQGCVGKEMKGVTVRHIGKSENYGVFFRSVPWIALWIGGLQVVSKRVSALGSYVASRLEHVGGKRMGNNYECVPLDPPAFFLGRGHPFHRKEIWTSPRFAVSRFVVFFFSEAVYIMPTRTVGSLVL